MKIGQPANWTDEHQTTYPAQIYKVNDDGTVDAVAFTPSPLVLANKEIAAKETPNAICLV